MCRSFRMCHWIELKILLATEDRILEDAIRETETASSKARLVFNETKGAVWTASLRRDAANTRFSSTPCSLRPDSVEFGCQCNFVKS